LSRSTLRAALIVVGGVLLAAAAVSALTGCSVGAVLRLAVPGLVLLFGVGLLFGYLAAERVTCL